MMINSNYNPYEHFSNGEIILRDRLAMDRTILANERTLLAYARTALAFSGAGVSLIKFFDWPAAAIIGCIMIPVGIIIGLIGVIRFIALQRGMCALSKPVTTDGK